MNRNLYEINFKVGRRSMRWTRFAVTAELAQSEVLPVLADEYDGKAKIVGIALTSVQAEDAR